MGGIRHTLERDYEYYLKSRQLLKRLLTILDSIAVTSSSHWNKVRDRLAAACGSIVSARVPRGVLRGWDR